MKLTEQKLSELAAPVARYIGYWIAEMVATAAETGESGSLLEADGFTHIAINAAIGGYVDKVHPMTEAPDEGDWVYLLMPDGSTLEEECRVIGGVFIHSITGEPLRVAPLGWWHSYVPKLTPEEFETFKEENHV